MKRMMVGLVFALTLTASLLAVDLDSPVARETVLTVRPGALRAHVKFLADDLLEGRGTGTRGFDLAARYVAAQFEAMGLEPAGTGGFEQQVPLRRSVVNLAKSSFAIERNGTTTDLTRETDFVLGPTWAATETFVAAPVVFVGFGVTAPEKNYDDYASIDVRDKVVAFMTGAPEKFPSYLRAHHASSVEKARNAAAHGAVGTITIRRPADEQRSPWDRVVRGSTHARMRWIDLDGTLINSFPAIQGLASVSRSGAEKLFAGSPRSLAEVFSTAGAGLPQAFPLPARVMLKTVNEHSSLKSPNVAGVLRGRDPVLKNEYLIYSAHLDHLGIGVPVAGDSIYNGAVDNASGIAGMLEVARLFAGMAERPRRSIVFLAVTGEESGLLGSDFFAHHPTVPLANIVTNLNMDTSNVLYPTRDLVALGAENSTLGQVARKAAAALNLQVSPDPKPEENYFVRSDQYSFIKMGIPALNLDAGLKSTDPKIDPAAIAREWVRSKYHSPQDDLTQVLDFEAAATVVKANFLVGYEVANATERPRWNEGDYFGQKYGR